MVSNSSDTTCGKTYSFTSVSFMTFDENQLLICEQVCLHSLFFSVDVVTYLSLCLYDIVSWLLSGEVRGCTPLCTVVVPWDSLIWGMLVSIWVTLTPNVSWLQLTGFEDSDVSMRYLSDRPENQKSLCSNFPQCDLQTMCMRNNFEVCVHVGMSMYVCLSMCTCVSACMCACVILLFTSWYFFLNG